MILSWQTEGDYEGLVLHIKNNSPQPERNEIIGLLGIKLISRNQNLWMEFKAVKTIVNESGVKSSSSVVPSKLEIKQKNMGKRSIANAISFSSAHYGCEDESSIHKIRKFTLESVLGMLDRIEGAIEEENALLDSEILRLNSELFSQSENVFAFSEVKDVKPLRTLEDSLEIPVRSHPSSNNNNQSPGDSISSSVSSPRGGLESARGGSGVGRFRSRLNSVRDELFFLEDF